MLGVQVCREAWSATALATPGSLRMTQTEHFALAVAAVAAVGLAVIASNRLVARIRVPVPGLVLVGAAVAATADPLLRPGERTVQDLVTVALVAVLFSGGLGIGWARVRASVGPIVVIGIVGTFLTAAAGTVAVRVLTGVGWYGALLTATAVAPTDPAVVFSVLGNRLVPGRSGDILEGEAGANDPVGIALMASLVAAGGISASGAGQAAWHFAIELGVGAAVGVAGGRLLLSAIRRLPLPGEGLYPLRTLAGALLLYGVAGAVGGSGFLAVFIAGVVLGDERAPFKREIERFHDALASLGEIVAFVALGLTVDLHVLARVGVWAPGIAFALVLAAVIRPLAVGPLLARVRLAANERAFVVFAGLKGAVPVLLGGYLLAARVPQERRLYGIVVVVVVVSVFFQGGLVDAFTRWVRLPVRTVEPEPWSLGVRLRHDPDGVTRLTVAPGAPVEGQRVDALPDFPPGAWITLLVRSGRLQPVRGDTVLRAGDAVTVIAGEDDEGALRHAFEGAPGPPPA